MVQQGSTRQIRYCRSPLHLVILIAIATLFDHSHRTYAYEYAYDYDRHAYTPDRLSRRLDGVET